MTCEKANPDKVEPINLPSNTEIGDFCVIKGVGAYCSSMSLKNYNSFPESAEVMVVAKSHEIKVIRKRQDYESIMENEVTLF